MRPRPGEARKHPGVPTSDSTTRHSHPSEPGAWQPDQAILHPSATPPRVRLEDALFDQCEIGTGGQVVHLALSAIQRRLTTAGRIGRAIEACPRHRYRGLIVEMLVEASEGVASTLELR